MTIAAELDRIISAKNDILSAINDKGVSTAGTTSISQCPALINAIQTGGGVTPSSMHSTAATVYQWSGSAEFYITMTQIPVLTLTNASITASATSWSTGRSGSFGNSAVGWKVAEFDTGILSCDGVKMSARGFPPIIRPFAANYRPSGTAAPSAVGTQFVWLGDPEYMTTTGSAVIFSNVYSLSAASVLSTSSPVYVGWQYIGLYSNFSKLSGAMKASGGDTATALPYPNRDPIIYETCPVSAQYSSKFVSGSAESRPGGGSSYSLKGYGIGFARGVDTVKYFIYPSVHTTSSANKTASSFLETRPGSLADNLYDCIENHSGYTATSTSVTSFTTGDLLTPYLTSVYPATAWASAITGSAWLGQSSVGHLF